MEISLEGIALSAVVGGVDLGAEFVDQDSKTYTPFMNVTDISRTAFFAGSLVGSYVVKKDKYQEYLTPVFYAAFPLFMKTMKRAVESWMSGTPSKPAPPKPKSVFVTSDSTFDSGSSVSVGGDDADLSRQIAESMVQSA